MGAVPEHAAPGVEPGGSRSDAGLENGLTDTERAVLEFERGWWRHGGAKESAIAELFGMTATRYYQTLNVLIDSPAALAADPMLVKRLRRLRAQRQQARQARRLTDLPAAGR
ncbi:MAG TPA: DUF3263 domain-containing protein [Micrococcales bacterium]|uniref:DUF3263 domain-containing protein n=1 Tax=Miniimonas arenae TaxID=676201 RepID=UPI000EC1CE9C|nr:DUF3263 domain-containing protein [Miniimonas arenae]HCX84008.1 DUF3263 domain-containing protein [Micrococcales bacterium]